MKKRRTRSRIFDRHYKRLELHGPKKSSGKRRVREPPVDHRRPSTPVGPRGCEAHATGQLVPTRLPEDACYVDTGLNMCTSMMSPRGTCWGGYERRPRRSTLYLGDWTMTLREILGVIATLVGRKPPRVRLPYGVVLPLHTWRKVSPSFPATAAESPWRACACRASACFFQAQKRRVNWATTFARRLRPSRMRSVGTARTVRYERFCACEQICAGSG